MYVVAAPAGSGKTSAFPGDFFGCDYFNADSYAAMPNGGLYVGIPRSIREEVGPICEKFIQDRIAAGGDFAIETTLRSKIVFDRTRQAHEVGFAVNFRFVCVDSIGTSVKRITQRAYQGGNSGSEDTIRTIRVMSLGNFSRVLDELGRTVDFLNVYDNSAHGAAPELVASFQGREIAFLALELTVWLSDALEQTPYNTKSLRACSEQGEPLSDPDWPKSSS